MRRLRLASSPTQRKHTPQRRRSGTRRGARATATAAAAQIFSRAPENDSHTAESTPPTLVTAAGWVATADDSSLNPIGCPAEAAALAPPKSTAFSSRRFMATHSSGMGERLAAFPSILPHSRSLKRWLYLRRVGWQRSPWAR